MGSTACARVCLRQTRHKDGKSASLIDRANCAQYHSVHVYHVRSNVVSVGLPDTHGASFTELTRVTRPWQTVTVQSAAVSKLMTIASNSPECLLTQRGGGPVQVNLTNLQYIMATRHFREFIAGRRGLWSSYVNCMHCE